MYLSLHLYLTSDAEKVLQEMTLGFTCSGQTCDIRCWSCPVKNGDQKMIWGEDPEGRVNSQKVYKESYIYMYIYMLSGGSGHAGWVIESYEDLWNQFSTQQLSHGNRHMQCKFCTLQHDCQIQILESWINPLFAPLTNNENTRNKKFDVPFHFASLFKELQYHWHSKSSSFWLWVWEITLLSKKKDEVLTSLQISVYVFIWLVCTHFHNLSLNSFLQPLLAMFSMTSWRWTLFLRWKL